MTKRMNSLITKKLIQQKREILYRILISESRDFYSCEEALNILIDLFGDVDLTLVQKNVADIKMIATTLNNEDNINALLGMVRYYLLSDSGKLAETVKIKARPEVLVTKTVTLDTGENVKAYLLIDVYSEEFAYDKEMFEELYQLLSLIVRLCILEEDRKHAYKVDSLTRIYTRDTLVKEIQKLLDLKLVPDKYEAHLAILYLSNGSQLNRDRGYEQVDKWLLDIAKTMKSQVEGGCVYRIGGLKFAAVIKKDLQESVFFMQHVLDLVQNIEKDLIFSVGVVPVHHDAYQTICVVEKNLKALDVNVVTAFSGDMAEAEDDFLKATTVFTPRSDEIVYVDKDVERKSVSFSVSEDGVAVESEIVETDEYEEGQAVDLEDANDGEGLTLDFGDSDEEDSENEEDADESENIFKKKKKGKDGEQISLFDI